MDKHRNSLQPGYKLHWYHIIEILGQGGFGITYLAHDTNLDQQVAIKEYLPNDLSVRDHDVSVHPMSEGHRESYEWGMERFISEARTLAKFKHANIVRVLSVFTENNTAYMVMEYEHGQPMDALLKNRKTIPEDKLKTILMPILDGLEEVHKHGFIHRDIKPPNIYIRTDGSPVLLDFGSARQSLGEQTQTLTSMVSPGYAPFEQYTSKGDKQGPWTDIYGLGATLYRAVIGVGPSDAMDRSEAILHTDKDVFMPASRIAPENYSPAFLAAIDHALLFKMDERPQTIAAWRTEIINGNSPVSGTSETSSSEGTSTASFSDIDKSIDTDAQTVTMPKFGSAADLTLLPTKSEDITQAATKKSSEAMTDIATQRVESDSEEKTVLLDAEEKRTDTTKKPRSLLRSLIKWLGIFFLILLFLSILKGVKNKRAVEEAASSAETQIENNIDVRQGSTDSRLDKSPSDNNAAEFLSGDVTPDGSSNVIDNTTAQRINALLSAARSNISELKLTSPLGNNAYEKYQTVLNLDPQNPEALNGLDKIVDEYIRLMDNALRKNDIVNARIYLQKGRNINPQHYGIADAERRLNNAVAARDAVRQQNSAQDSPANASSKEGSPKQAPASNDGKLISDSDKRKLEQIRRKLIHNPNDMKARKELKKMAENFQDKIKEALHDNKFDVAEAYVLEIMDITPDNSKAQSELNDLLARIKARK